VINQADPVKGLNGLKGFEIIAAQALVTPDPDGSNFRGVANLPNPSIVAFELVSTDVVGACGVMLTSGRATKRLIS
jgi:hypothetical protein